MDLSRIQKELKEIHRDKESGVTVEVVGDNFRELRGSVPGPVDTPYEGGLFIVDIKLGVQYPFVPPRMKFITKVWHPNVSSQSGAICLDILKDQWSPALTLKTALLSLQALLASPQPDDPQDAVVAKQYMMDHGLFRATAAEWTSTYASGTKQNEQVNQMVEMGFSEESARSALLAAGGDAQVALEKLLAAS